MISASKQLRPMHQTTWPLGLDQDFDILHSLLHIKFGVSQNLAKFCFLSAPGIELQNWTSFLYIDVSELPILTARWLQAPSQFGVQKYRLEVFKKVAGSEMNLQASEVIQGTNDDHELSYKFDTFLSSGVYHFEVCIVSDNCTNGLCQVSKSPDVPVRKYNGLNYINVLLCHK